MLSEKISRLLESSKFIVFIQCCIVISIVAFSIETLPNISSKTTEILNYIEIFIVGVFTLEYIANVYSHKKSFKFIFSFY